MRAITMLPMDREHNRRAFNSELDSISSQLPDSQKVLFKNCRESVDKFYFGTNGDSYKFNHWNHHDSMSTGNLSTDSNPAESVNFSYNSFKQKTGKNGRMTIPKVLHNIFWFKYKAMTKKADAARDHKNLPKRRRETLEHEAEKEQLNIEFNRLDQDGQSRSIVQYLVKFANVAKVNERMFLLTDEDSISLDPENSLTGPLMTTLE